MSNEALYWTLTIVWWLLGAPLLLFGTMFLAYWLAERKNNKNETKRDNKRD